MHPFLLSSTATRKGRESSVVQRILPISHLLIVASSVIRLMRYPRAWVQMTFFLLKMAPLCKRSDTGNSDVPKRSCKALFKWKGEHSWLSKRGKKKSYAEAAKTYNKYTSSTCEIVKKEKKICVSFVVAPPTAKITAMVHSKSLVKMEKAFEKLCN